MGWWWSARRRSSGRPGGRHEAAEAFAGVPAHDEHGRPVRVTILGRDGCHLCEVAEQTVAEVSARCGAGYAVRDLDELPDLLPRYGDEVPVVFVDGVRFARWRVDPAALRGVLLRGARR